MGRTKKSVEITPAAPAKLVETSIAKRIAALPLMGQSLETPPREARYFPLASAFDRGHGMRKS